jgi:hypothetical protein
MKLILVSLLWFSSAFGQIYPKYQSCVLEWFQEFNCSQSKYLYLANLKQGKSIIVLNFEETTFPTKLHLYVGDSFLDETPEVYVIHNLQVIGKFKKVGKWLIADLPRFSGNLVIVQANYSDILAYSYKFKPFLTY